MFETNVLDYTSEALSIIFNVTQAESKGPQMLQTQK